MQRKRPHNSNNFIDSIENMLEFLREVWQTPNKNLRRKIDKSFLLAGPLFLSHIRPSTINKCHAVVAERG